jgi:DNA-binding PadR family transcriptional regulator
MGRHARLLGSAAHSRAQRRSLPDRGRALYPALHRLERQAWIESDWGLSENNRKAKFYQLTPRGRAQLRTEVATWQRYTKAVAGVLEPA